MVRDTLTAAFYETQQKHAHPTFRTLQMLGLKHLLWFNSVLKIRVSAVRFCPRPPVLHRKCESAYGVSICSASVIHTTPTLCLLATRCGAC